MKKQDTDKLLEQYDNNPYSKIQRLQEEIETCKKAVELLIVGGFISEEKWEQAMTLARGFK